MGVFMDNQNFNSMSTRSNGFITASFALGIIGIATGCCVYTSIICGALAIMFALLSKGGMPAMPSKAKIGLTLGIVSILLGVIVFIAMLVIAISSFGSFENFWYEYSDILNELDTALPYTL